MCIRKSGQFCFNLFITVFFLVLFSCQKKVTIDQLATDYVKLCLYAGNHDPDFVDAYYGPDSLRPADTIAIDVIIQRAEKIKSDLAESDIKKDTQGNYRVTMLQKQLTALITRMQIISGKSFSFDEESRLLYDTVAPNFPESYFQEKLKKLDSILPGKGSITERLEQFRSSFIIPKEKLDTVFKTAIKEGRRRTLEKISLPENENFVVEYVTKKSWSGYNWFKGSYYSVIQVNTDLPIFIGRAIDLACHEGYPGHHVFNSLIEQNLVNKNKFVEFSLYPLFSPLSLVAEGSANYGIDVAFPGASRIEFEKKVLFPLAGLDSSKASKYYEIQSYTKGLSYAGNEAARKLLNKEITEEEAKTWLVNYALMSPERAAQRIKFIQKYRSYVINYNFGQDLVRNYVESAEKKTGRERWDIFREILQAPPAPSDLK
jgi:hypothetical protein